MVPQWIIEKKRDGMCLTSEEIHFFLKGYTRGEIPDYQMAALAMAIFFNGMNDEETAILTDVMMRSGTIIDTSSVPGPKLDKHSTGGIGDKVSLILAPLVAVCGASVPMISGRGLGITGGTLDKLESIPGYRTNLSEREFLRVVRECGCSITGQTGELAPADKKLYALRDVTGTVASIPLIVASIMCKKLAEGIDALVLDVKCGKGAFMRTAEQAKELARRMTAVGLSMGKRVSVLITPMDQPLGRTVGNALEVREAVEVLRGTGAPDLRHITLELAKELLVIGGISKTHEEAQRVLLTKLSNGEAFDCFKKMVALHGGDIKVIENPCKFMETEFKRELRSNDSGYVAGADAELIGRAALVLGAGREKISDTINPAVGFSEIRKCGERVNKGEPFLIMHAASERALEEAEALLREAFIVEGKKPDSAGSSVQRYAELIQ